MQNIQPEEKNIEIFNEKSVMANTETIWNGIVFVVVDIVKVVVTV